jgi:hypothetical protein
MVLRAFTIGHFQLAKLIVCHDFIVDLNDGLSEA